jgi:hypothetical protein
MTWELYLYSAGMKEELLEYWDEREKEKEIQKKKGIPLEHSFRRIDEVEKSVEIFDGKAKAGQKGESSLKGS